MSIGECAICAHEKMEFSIQNLTESIIPVIACPECKVSFKYGFEALDYDIDVLKVKSIKQYNAFVARVRKGIVAEAASGG